MIKGETFVYINLLRIPILYIMLIFKIESFNLFFIVDHLNPSIPGNHLI